MGGPPWRCMNSYVLDNIGEFVVYIAVDVSERTSRGFRNNLQTLRL
jgi:hypothetical protein